ncbi:hypothetical protein [Nocardiopsis sp. CC223A]|uniref:hypothetical protein n=1 Tax=Nocardiopsis sp. CC223A TaxID=3044051 RepID=UPI00278C372A|nr:hypothetical protein [Nocardiopsis sp. CC223A]
MEQLSYDPLLTQEEIQPFRLFKPLQSPEHGTAMVLEPHKGQAVLVRPGEEVPDARFGTYKRMSLIDTGEHRLAFQVTLVSRDPSFGFRATVTLSCRVIDPVGVVQRGIRDMAPTLKGPLKRMLRDVSGRFDISEFHETERALNESVAAFTGDSAIRLRRIVVELQVDEEEITTGGRAFRDKMRAQRLDAMGRSYNLRILREEGPEALLAGMLEREGERAVLEWIRSEEVAERAELMRALDMVMGHSSEDREPFDSAEIERDIVHRLIEDRSSRTTGSIGRVRGALGSGRSPGHRPPRELEGGTGPEEAGDRRRPRGRTIHGEFDAPVPVGPPEDEPLPPTEQEERRARRPERGDTFSDTDRAQQHRPRTSRVRGVRGDGRGNDR